MTTNGYTFLRMAPPRQRALSSFSARAPVRDFPRMLLRRLKLSVFCALLLTAAPAMQGQANAPAPGSPHAAITRAQGKISVDGKLDEPDWAAAAPISEILQREPHPGQLATEKTELRLLYDADHLYIGVTCFDSEPRKIIATQMARDADLSADDRVEILLDTFRDQRNAFYFATNPTGALVDGLVIENGDLNRNWDAIWHVRTQRFDGGWRAEFAIPFKSLGFRAGAASWGFNFSRTIKRKIEEDRWAAPRLDVKFLQVSEAGEISGLTDVRQGHGLDVRPFAAGRWLHDAQSRNDTVTGKPGLDIFYNLTPSLKWSTTFNTDFGETEVDARRINLTRFPLFFPEKRSFFLENAGVFEFGFIARPFFSRRIGLLSGQEVPILFGTKLTGKVGRTDIGVLDVRTRETNFAPAKNFFVARVKQNLFSQSYIGAIYTEGDPANPTGSRTFGADLGLSTTNFLGRKRNFNASAFAVKSHNAGVRGDDAAFGFSAEYPSDLFSARFLWSEVGKNYRPALGFAPRPDVRLLLAGFEYDPRPKKFLNVRQMFHEFFYERYTRVSLGQVESWRLFTAPINWVFNSGDRIEFNYAPQFERLFAPFEISTGVFIPPGDYRFTRWRAEFGTASKRRWRVEGTWWFGTYWSGHADQIEFSLQYKIAPRLQFSFDTEQTFARLPQGNFVARIYSFRANYSVSPFLSFSNLVQFDNESRDLGWQSRVRWILRPGNDLFLVFSQGWLQNPRGGFHFSPADTKLSTKFQYTFRF